MLLPEILGRAQVWAYEYSEYDEEERIHHQTGHHPVGLADLIPDDARRVLLAGSTHTSARALHRLFAGLGGARLEMQGAKPETGEAASDEAHLLSGRWCQRVFEAIREFQARVHHRDEWHPDRDETFWPAVARDAADDATRKAAAVLGVPPIAVALAARALWGAWGLTGEREHRLMGSLHVAIIPGARVNEQFLAKIERLDWKLTDEQKQALREWNMRGLGKREGALPPGSRRKLQAMRGHLTRDLIRELRPLVKDVKKKSTKRKRPRK